MQTLTKDPVIIGILVEEGLDRYMKSLGFVTQMRYETNIDGHKISGRVDYYDFERKIGVELKSPIYVKKNLRRHSITLIRLKRIFGFHSIVNILLKK